MKTATWIINRSVNVSINIQNNLLSLNQKILNQSIRTDEMQEYIYLLKLWQAIIDVERYRYNREKHSDVHS